MTIEAIGQKAQEAGLAVIGISDHIWLDLERGSRPAIEHLLASRDEIDAYGGATRILLGAEADCAPGRGAAGGEGLRLLDYTVGSYHFAEVREHQAEPPETPEQLAIMLVEGFRSVVESPHINICGHPLHIPRRIYRAMPDSLFDLLPEAYRRAISAAKPHLVTAAGKGVIIEMNSHALFPKVREGMLPFFRLAREAGCRFAVTSDAHRPGEVGRGRAETIEYAGRAGITDALLFDAGSIQRRGA
jgi:histidinol phosphatase-like PHP family hydrolase